MSKNDTWRQTVHMHMLDFIGVEKQSSDCTLTWSMVGERNNPRARVSWRRHDAFTVKQATHGKQEARQHDGTGRLKEYVETQCSIALMMGGA